MAEDADTDAVFLGEDDVGEVVADLGDDDAGAAPLDSDDDDGGGGPSGPGGADGDGDGEPMDGADGGPAPDIEDLSIHSFDGHRDAVFAVAFNPVHPTVVATGGGDDRAFLFQVGSSDGTTELTGHTDTVCSVGFSADGALLATGGLDGCVRVWDAGTGAAVCALDGPADGLEWVAWHPRGHVLLAGSDDFCAWMWNADTGATMGVLAGHAGAVRCGGWTADGKAAVTGGGEGDASLRAWDPKTGACTATLSGHGFHEGGLTSLAVAGPDTPTIVLTGGEDGTARLSNVSGGGRVVGTLDPAAHTDSVEAVAFGPPSLPLLATAGMDGKLILWDAGSLAPRCVCEHGPDGVTCLAFAPAAAAARAALVATGGLDGVVRVWDSRTGQCVQALTGHAKGVQAVAWAAGGDVLLSGSDDGTAKVWDLRSV